MFKTLKQRCKENFASKSKKEIAYDIFAILIIISVSTILIIKDYTAEKTIAEVFNKANIKYAGIDCEGVFSTDCKISKINSPIISINELEIKDVLNATGSYKEKTEIDVRMSGLYFSKAAENSLTEFKIAEIISKEIFLKNINNSTLKIKTNIVWGKDGTPEDIENLNIDFKSNLTNISLATSMDKMDSDPIVKYINFNFSTKGLFDSLFERYEKSIQKIGINKTNSEFFGEINDKKYTQKELTKKIKSALFDSIESEISFYKNSKTFYGSYYAAADVFLKSEKENIYVNIQNKKQLPSAELLFYYSMPNADILDVNISVR